MMFKINLSQRNDTGRINTSPDCNIRPYIKYNQTCQPFKIPVSDVDGDVTKCRCDQVSMRPSVVARIADVWLMLL